MTEGYKRDIIKTTLDDLKVELTRLLEDNKRKIDEIVVSRNRYKVEKFTHAIKINNECIKYILKLIGNLEEADHRDE